MRGKLVVFEGIDCSGKGTQISLLQDILAIDEIRCEIFSFPHKQSVTGGVLNTFLSQMIDLDPKAAHLMFSANRWEMQERIKYLLEDGVNVILDRYFHSGIAYSVGAMGLDFKWVVESERGLIAPDLVVYMNTDPLLCAQRKGFGEQRYDNVEILSRVQAVYQQLKTKEWIIIDGNKSVERIAKDVQPGIYRLLYNLQSKE